MLCTYTLGFLFNIILVYCMGDPSEVLGSPIAQPVAQIFFNSLGKRAGIFFTVGAFVVLQLTCFTATQALARTIFAYSRDRLIPGSKIWTKINRSTGTPLYAVWISILFCILINLIGLGSYTAISGVFSVCAIALDWSYVIPIMCKLMFSRFTPGPWYMGKPGIFVNACACLWTLFVSVIFILPTVRPVTAGNMNYAIAFLGGICITAAVWWYAGGKKRYKGALNQIDTDVPLIDMGSSAVDWAGRGGEAVHRRDRNLFDCRVSS
jgi:amino acid transporter